MSRMPAFVEQLFWRLPLPPNRRQLLSPRVGFAEMSAESALSIM